MSDDVGKVVPINRRHKRALDARRRGGVTIDQLKRSNMSLKWLLIALLLERDDPNEELDFGMDELEMLNPDAVEITSDPKARRVFIRLDDNKLDGLRVDKPSDDQNPS